MTDQIPAPGRLFLTLGALLVLMNAFQYTDVVDAGAVAGQVLAACAVGWVVLRRDGPRRGRTWHRWSWIRPPAERFAAVGLLLVALVGALPPSLRAVHAGTAVSLLVAATLVVLVWLAVLSERYRWRLAAFCGAIGVHLVLLVVQVRLLTPDLDVFVFERDAAKVLLAGHDPYTMTFPDIYPPVFSDRFYGPGLVSGGRLTFGYPYPPPTLLGALPGSALGDVRFALVAAVLLAGCLLWWVARDAAGRAAALALPFCSLTRTMTVFGWVEPTIVLLLVLVVVGLHRGWRLSPVLLGLLLASKQYFAVALPALWLLRGYRPAAWRRLLIGVVATGVAVVLPFLLWDPAGFWRSVVWLQLHQPFRADSTSLLVLSVRRLGWPPASVWGWLPLAAGTIAATLGAWRAPRTPAGFSAVVGFSLLATILLSKQAFANYYLTVFAAVVTAVVTWPSPDPGNPGPEDRPGDVLTSEPAVRAP